MKRSLVMRVFLIPFLLVLVLLLSSCNNRLADPVDFLENYQEGNGYLKSAMISLHFIMETSRIAKVDSLFSSMIENNDLPVNASNCADGTYTGRSPYDAYDYEHVAQIRIKDGKITGIDYDEIHRNGTGKKDNEAYCKKMKVSGTTPAFAYPTMEAQLLSSQDLNEVDAVAGATYSLYRFRYATVLALIKAEMEKNKETRQAN